MSKTTSVEWLAQAIYDKMKMKGDGKVFQGILDEAKAMHKEEIEEAYRYSRAHWSREDGNPEQYYNETYKGGEQ